MKSIKYIISIFTLLFIWSCDTVELEEVRAVDESEIVAPTLQSMETVIIDQNSYDNKETVTFSWDPADFGFNAAVVYSIYLTTDSISDYNLASNINSTSFTIDHQALFDKLIGENNLALPTNEVSTVSVYITATVGSDFTVVKSGAQSIDFDIAKIGLDGDLLYISGEYNDWSDSRSAIVGLEKVYSGYVDMNWKNHENTEYKFVDFLYASVDWGDWYGGSLDALSPSAGESLNITPGMKFFNVDLNTKTATVMNFTKVGLTGINGQWGTPAVEMEYDYNNKYYYVVSEADTKGFRILCYSPEDTGWGWSYTMGPRTIDELHISLGSDVKVFDSSISKPLVGGDPNMSLDEAGTYKFILYYTATDASWHFKVERP
jgi:hypothetical protein